MDDCLAVSFGPFRAVPGFERDPSGIPCGEHEFFPMQTPMKITPTPEFATVRSPVVRRPRAKRVGWRLGIPACVALALCTVATGSAADAAGKADDAVKLGAFEVSSKRVGPYQVSDSTSGGRIRTDIFESTQGISVITRELIQDMGATDALNALQLVAGISNNSTSIGDRLSIRGYQGGIGSMDGFSAPSSQVKLDPAIFERIEFVRGPNAILSPGGPPGGTINIITKVAELKDFGRFDVQVGRYDTNRADLDLNRTLSRDSAFRLVVAGKYHTQGKNQGYARGLTVLPSFTKRIGSNSRLTFEYIFSWGNGLNYTGLPLDPSVSPLTDVKLRAGVNPYQSAYADNADDPSAMNRTSTNNYRVLFTSTVSDSFSLRLAARAWTGWDSNNQWNLLGNSGGAVNPKTGLFTPGFTFGGAPDFRPTPAAPISNLYSLSQAPSNSFARNFEFQNDYVHRTSAAGAAFETSGGISGAISRSRGTGYAASSPAIDIFNVPAKATYTINNLASTDRLTVTKSLQVYLNENVRLLGGKFVVNAGLAQNWYHGRIDDYRNKLSYFTHPAPLVKNYGVVFHPASDVSLYYGHTENASQIVQPRQSGRNNELQDGRQDEVGVRYKFLESKAVVSVAYYDSSQSNNSILNPALFSVPPPVVAPPPLFMDRVARGWEYELNMAVSSSLSVIANYTNFRNRSPYGTPFRGASENSGAAWAYYRFQSGAAKGLSLGLGYVRAGKRPGDTGSGYTAASTDSNLIRVQPTFYLPVTSLVNFSAAYRFHEALTGRVFVDNVTDAVYYRGAINRNGVYPGIPRNFRVAMEYSF